MYASVIFINEKIHVAHWHMTDIYLYHWATLHTENLLQNKFNAQIRNTVKRNSSWSKSCVYF